MKKNISEFIKEKQKDMMKYLMELYEFQEKIKVTYEEKKKEG